MAKIVKNTTNSDITLSSVGRILFANSDYVIPPLEYGLWAEQDSLDEISPIISSGDIIIGDVGENFPANIALSHLSNNIVFVHDDIGLLPGAGENAPSLISVGSSAVGFSLDIGDKIYGQTRIDRLLGSFVEFQIHYTIDNADADRYVQFEFSYFTSNGSSDFKTINIPDGTITVGPHLVSSSPFLMRQVVVNIPTTSFNSGENYLFVGVTRVSPTSGSSPTNNPIVLRYCKRYYRVEK